MTILLDSGPLGLLTHPKPNNEARECAIWLTRLQRSGIEVVLPEVIDYEVRRELLRAHLHQSVRRLDLLAEELTFQPLNRDAMRMAARLWADARQQGRPTADSAALDVDMILCAQARLIQQAVGRTVIASANLRHLLLFTEAAPWRAITVDET